MVPRKVRPASGLIPQASPIPGTILDPKSRVKATLERLFSDLNPNTMRAYQKAWDVLAEYLKVPSRMEAAGYVIKLSGGEANALAMQWISDMKRDGLKAATVSARLAGLKGITKRLRIVGLITWTIEIKGPKVNRYKDTTGPGQEIVKRVTEELRAQQTPKAARDLAIIHSLYTTGLRRGELAKLLLEGLDLGKNRLWITGKARDDEEAIPVQPRAKEAIEAWLKARPGDSPYVFVSLDPNSHGKPLSENGIWKITTSYGIGRPHGIRHSGITRVLDKTGGNIRMAQAFSRHKDLRVLVVYDDHRKNLAGEAGKLLEDDL